MLAKCISYLLKYHIHLPKYKHWHSTETSNDIFVCCRHAQHYEYVKSAYETISLMSLHSYWSISFPAMPHLWILQSTQLKWYVDWAKAGLQSAALYLYDKAWIPRTPGDSPKVLFKANTIETPSDICQGTLINPSKSNP